MNCRANSCTLFRFWPLNFVPIFHGQLWLPKSAVGQLLFPIARRDHLSALSPTYPALVWIFLSHAFVSPVPEAWLSVSRVDSHPVPSDIRHCVRVNNSQTLAVPGLRFVGRCTELWDGLLHICLAKDSSTPQFNSLFCTEAQLSTNTGELVLLFVTVVFRLIARKKIAKLEARLFLEFASPGPNSWGVRAIMWSYQNLGLLR